MNGWAGLPGGAGEFEQGVQVSGGFEDGCARQQEDRDCGREQEGAPL